MSTRAKLAFVLVLLFVSGWMRVRTQAPKAPVLGEGERQFQWVDGWGTLPEGVSYGNTHGAIVVDSRGRIYVNTDTERAVIVFEPDGRFVKSWGKDLSGGLHGMALARDGEREFLVLAHTARHEVLGATLDGEILWTLPFPDAPGVYEKHEQYNPTAVAIAPDGRIFVADGYGRSWVHEYDKERKYVRSFGGRGSEPGKFETPHGLWIDTRGKEPRLIVADRENHRLQVYGLDGKLERVVEGELRRPCGMHQWKDLLAVADLAGRVTVLDGDFKLVEHLGDNPDEAKRAQNGVPPEQWKPGEFIAPHSVRFDEGGNLYVMDWVSAGRVTKLARIAK
jgi:DNA-binding beta-propeller fold protein YncE